MADFLHFMASQAERRIAQAQKDGEFDHLPGEGRPLALEDDSHIPHELRMAFKVLKNADNENITETAAKAQAEKKEAAIK